jgi:hypothetical protein
LLALGFEFMLANQVTLLLEPVYQPLFMMVFFQDIEVRTICQGLASNFNPPDLCLLA